MERHKGVPRRITVVCLVFGKEVFVVGDWSVHGGVVVNPEH